MNIYVFSDESGVFDCVHNDKFVFAGLIVIGNEELATLSHKYSHVEKTMRKIKKDDKNFELKATNLTLKERYKMYRSLNNVYKFVIVINQKDILSNIFNNKKDKQRYLDYAFKIGLKQAFIDLIKAKVIIPSEVKYICVKVDEHSTATSGRYELEQLLEREFKIGTYNQKWSKYFPPIFKNIDKVKVLLTDSKSELLVRAADIVANKMFFFAVTDINKINNIKNVSLTIMPNTNTIK